jgi:hypothetical protein
MNYPESLEIGQGWQPHAQKPKTGKEKALLAALRKKGLAR